MIENNKLIYAVQNIKAACSFIHSNMQQFLPYMHTHKYIWLAVEIYSMPFYPPCTKENLLITEKNNNLLPFAQYTTDLVNFSRCFTNEQLFPVC